LNGQTIECICNNKNVIHECPDIEHILNKTTNKNIYIVHKNTQIDDIYIKYLNNICNIMKQFILVQNNNIIEFNKLDTHIKIYLPFLDDYI